jgi:hypothetical protein
MKRVTQRFVGAICMLACIALAGCATLTPDFDPPKVTVDSFRSIPSDGVGPRFEIGLRIANPNQQSLDVAGIAYDIEIMGKELVSGVSNEVPLIEGYSEETVTLTAGVNFISVLRLITDLGGQPTDQLEYKFKAKIDFNGFIPTQRVEESGVIALNPAK